MIPLPELEPVMALASEVHNGSTNTRKDSIRLSPRGRGQILRCGIKAKRTLEKSARRRKRTSRTTGLQTV